VICVGRPDEAVIGDVQRLVHVPEDGGYLVDEGLGCLSLAFRVPLHLLPMLIRSGQEEDVIAIQPFEARDRIGAYLLVGVPDVWAAVRVVDGRRDIEFRLSRHAARPVEIVSARALLDLPEVVQDREHERPPVQIVGLDLPCGTLELLP
jgi:hypothetical protein